MERRQELRSKRIPLIFVLLALMTTQRSHGAADASLFNKCPATDLIQPPETPPQLLNREEPKLPDCANGKRVEQPAPNVFTATVLSDGSVCDVKLIRKSEVKLCTDLSAECLEAIQHWRFLPAKSGGKPVATQIAITCGVHVH